MSAAPRISKEGVPSAVSRVLRCRRVWVIQGVGTLVWLAVAYAWFWIREARWWHLAESALLGLFLVYLGAFLQRTALRVYRRDRLGPERRAASGETGRGVAGHWAPRALVVFVLFAGLAWLAAELLEWLPAGTQSAASWLTLHLRRPVDPYLLQERAESVEFIGGWFLFVLIWLPLAAAAFLKEAGMWRAAARAWRSLRYWLGTLTCAVVGDLAFWKLAEWVPKVDGIPAQTASMVARLALGYVIALGAWLVTLALVEEGISSSVPRSPDETWD